MFTSDLREKMTHVHESAFKEKSTICVQLSWNMVRKWLPHWIVIKFQKDYTKIVDLFLRANFWLCAGFFLLNLITACDDKKIKPKIFQLKYLQSLYTANTYSQFTVISCVTCATVIWQWLSQTRTVHMTLTDNEE